MRNSNIASTALLYQNRTELEQFIQEYCLPARREDSSWLVMIHTSCHTPEGAVAIAKRVSELLPDAKILGTSASAVIYHGSIYEDGCLLIFTRLLHTQVKVQPLSFADKTPGALAEETAGLLTPDSKAMFAFFTDQYMQMQPYLDRLEETGADIPAAGGMITNNLYGTFAFDENGIYHNTALLAILNNEQLRTWSGAVTGLETFGGTHRITKSNHDYIAEIEQQPAVQWFQKMLRELRHAKDDGLSEDLLLHFPLRLQKPGNPGQFIHYCEPRDRIETYSNWLPPGTEFQMAYLSPMTAAAELQKQCSELETTPCEVIFTYPGTLHRIAMQNCTEWELRVFRSCRICGAFLYGEISRAAQHNQVYVGANTLFGLSASNHAYLPIDWTALEDLQTLDADWHNINQYLEHMRQKADLPSIAKQIQLQEALLQSNMFFDKEMELDNLVKFKFDDRKQRFDKICMISIEKGILISGRRGTKVWNQLMRENIQQMIRTLHDTELSFYFNDTWSFFFAAGPDYPDDKFLAQAELAFHECGYYFCKELNITAVNIFHVVIGETNLLEKVQLCMSAVADHNARFFLYNKDNAETMKQMDEKLRMTNIISDAILYDRIVPYFQPIRDNRTQEITKYEALMRLSDKDHNIYAPGQFLEIAKDYHLYLQLSQLMIQKVLELFRDRKETVFLNLSAYDISSSASRSLLYDLLSDLPPGACERITFEILESEKIRDFNEMVDFLNEIRKFGVKIAIDDFGAGFSNFTAILQINPDFIKIDGDLIINCDKDPMKQLCLQAISDIAKGINAELIAEHVENSGEQQTVESTNIQYTQGYYFSKPLPYQNLEQKKE